MAEEIVLDLKVDDHGAGRTVGDLKKSIVDLEEAIEKTAIGSREYRKLAQELGNAKMAFKDFEEEVEAFDVRRRGEAFAQVGNALAGGFAAATGAAQLFGAESESVEKAILKVQAATALAQGVQSIADAQKHLGVIKHIALLKLEQIEKAKGITVTKNATVVQRVFNVAMRSNPAGLLIGALTSLVAVFAIFKANAEDATRAQEEFNEAQEKSIDIIGRRSQLVIDRIDAELKLMKAKGASQAEIDAMEADLFAKQEERLKQQLSIAHSQLATLDTIKFKNAEQIAQYNELKETIFDLETSIIELAATRLQTSEEERKANQEALAALKQFQEEWKAQEKQFSEEEKERRRQEAAENEEFIKAFNEERRRSRLSETEIEIEDATRLKDELIQRGYDRRDAEMWLQGEILRIKDEARQADLEREKEKNAEELADAQRTRDAKLQMAQDSVNILSSLGSILIRDGEKQKKFQKAVALFQIAVDTAKALVAAQAAAAANPTNAVTFGASGIAQYISVAAIILSNVAKAKAILSSAESGGGSSPTPSASGGGGGITGPSFNPGNNTTPGLPPSFNPGGSGNSGTSSGGGGLPPQRVFVVERDIRDTGKRVDVIEKLGTVGDN